MNVRAGWINIVGLDSATGRVTCTARLSINGITDVTRNDTWLDSVVPQLFNVENLPIQFMPARGNDSIVEQQCVHHLTTDNSADYWQVETEQEQTGNGANDGAGENMETSTNNPQVHQVVDNDSGEVTGPVGVGSVEQNLARLAIVPTSSA